MARRDAPGEPRPGVRRSARARTHPPDAGRGDRPLERRLPGPRGARVARYTPHDLEAGGAVGGNGSAADLVFVNGAVYRVDATRSWAQSVAVRDGRIERDADGSPSGTLHEGAMRFVGDLVPPSRPDVVASGLVEGQAYLHALGITAWQDAIVEAGSADWTGSFEAYVDAAEEGTLTARVVGALWWDRNAGLEQIDSLVALRGRGVTGRFAATSVKIMQDGVCENFTAAFLDPYLGANGLATA